MVESRDAGREGVGVVVRNDEGGFLLRAILGRGAEEEMRCALWVGVIMRVLVT
jgi:hypothetical protein